MKIKIQKGRKRQSQQKKLLQLDIKAILKFPKPLQRGHSVLTKIALIRERGGSKSSLTSSFNIAEKICKVVEEADTCTLCLTTSEGTRIKQAT